MLNTKPPHSAEILQSGNELTHIRSGLPIIAFVVKGKSPSNKPMRMQFAGDIQGFNTLKQLKLGEPKYIAVLKGGEEAEFRFAEGA